MRRFSSPEVLRVLVVRIVRLLLVGRVAANGISVGRHIPAVLEVAEVFLLVLGVRDAQLLSGILRQKKTVFVGVVGCLTTFHRRWHSAEVFVALLAQPAQHPLVERISEVELRFVGGPKHEATDCRHVQFNQLLCWNFSRQLAQDF